MSLPNLLFLDKQIISGLGIANTFFREVENMLFRQFTANDNAVKPNVL